MTRPRGTRSTQRSTSSTYSSGSILTRPASGVDASGRHDSADERGDASPASQIPAGAPAGPRSSRGQPPDQRDAQQHQRARAQPQRSSAAAVDRQRRRGRTTRAARPRGRRPAPGRDRAAPPGAAPSRSQTAHQASTRTSATVPSGRTRGRRRSPAITSDDEHDQPDGRRVARRAGAGQQRQHRTPSDHDRAQHPLAAGPAPDHRATTCGQLGTPGQPAQHVVEGARARATAPPGSPAPRAGPSSWSARSGASARPGRRPPGRCPSVTAGAASGGSVSTTSTGSPRRTSVAVAVRDRLGQHRRQHDHDGAGGRPELERSGRAGRAASPGRTRASRPSSIAQVAARRRRSRRPARRAARPPAARPGRPRRTWCSASAAAARTVTSRLLGAPSTPPEAPWSASASTTSSTPVSSSARVVTTCSAPVRSETRQLIRRSRSPAWNGRIAGELGAVADPPRPVRADQADRLRRLRRASRTAPARAAPASSGRRAAPGPSGSRPRPLVSATFSSPRIRRPQRRGLTSTPGPGPSASMQAADPAVGGCIATYGAGAATRVTCSASSASSTTSRTGCPGPRGASTWSRRDDQPRLAGRPVQQPERRQHQRAARRARPAPGRRAAPRPRSRRADAASARPSGRGGRQRVIAAGTCSSVAGVGTSPSTASTTRRPLASVIQSSGLTVIRCDEHRRGRPP